MKRAPASHGRKKVLQKPKYRVCIAAAAAAPPPSTTMVLNNTKFSAFLKAQVGTSRLAKGVVPRMNELLLKEVSHLVTRAAIVRDGRQAQTLQVKDMNSIKTGASTGASCNPILPYILMSVLKAEVSRLAGRASSKFITRLVVMLNTRVFYICEELRTLLRRSSRKTIGVRDVNFAVEFMKPGKTHAY